MSYVLLLRWALYSVVLCRLRLPLLESHGSSLEGGQNGMSDAWPLLSEARRLVAAKPRHLC